MEVDFGEILEPVSRAFWDDYDDLTDNEEYRNPEWNAEEKDIVCPANTESLVVLEGDKVEELMKLLLLRDTNPIAKLKSGKVSLYYLAALKTVVCVSEEKNLNYYGAITELLKPFLEKVPQIVSISIQPSSLHRGSRDVDADKVSFIRGIDSHLPDVTPLREPNFITGLCAGVASWRKFNNLTTPCYVVYVESLRLDTQTIEPLVRVLDKIGLPCREIPNLNIKATDSNLYM